MIFKKLNKLKNILEKFEKKLKIHIYIKLKII